MPNDNPLAGLSLIGSRVCLDFVNTVDEHTPSRAFDLLHAYFAPMRWYVQDGRTPTGADGGTLVGHLPRPRFSVDALEPEVEAALLPLAGVSR